MPIYEFRCQDCRRKTSVFLRSISRSLAPTCPTCGSANLVRTISSFAYHKSEQTRLEEAGEPSMSPGLDYYKDPRNIGRWAEKRMEDMGVEMPDQIKEMIGKAREGEVSDILEKRGLD